MLDVPLEEEYSWQKPSPEGPWDSGQECCMRPTFPLHFCKGCRSSWGPGAPLLRAARLLSAVLEAPRARGPAGQSVCHRLARLLGLFAAARSGRGAGGSEQGCVCLGEPGGLGARHGMAPRPAAAPRCALAPFWAFCGCFLYVPWPCLR